MRRACFLTPLVAEHLPSGRWRLKSPLKYQSLIVEWIVSVPKGFETDFASVPRLPLAYLLAGDTAHEAAVVHDFLYSSGICPRQEADAIFFEAIGVLDEPGWRRWAMWSAVRAGGGAAWRKYRKLAPPE